MSVATKRRYVQGQLEAEMYEPKDDETVAQIVAARGNNLHEVLDEHNDTYLVSMPSKFRKAVWVRKGSFVVVKPIDEGDKVKAEIMHVLDNENIMHLFNEDKWPAYFEEFVQHLIPEMDKERLPDVAEDRRLTTNLIDDDMLPPSDSDEDEDEEDLEGEGNEGEEGEENVEGEEEEEDDQPAIFNPNRAAAPTR